MGDILTIRLINMMFYLNRLRVYQDKFIKPESELGWLSVSEPSEDVPNLLILRFCSFWEVLRVTGLVLLPGGVSSITGVQETQGSDGEDHGKAESMNMQKMNNKNK